MFQINVGNAGGGQRGQEIYPSAEAEADRLDRVKQHKTEGI